MIKWDIQKNDTADIGVAVERVLICLAFIGFFVAYKSAFSNFFVGDDFVYLSWFNHVWEQPSKLIEQFFGNSLDSNTTKFYRPLLSLSMAFDAFIWKRNALGFHLTNLFFHCLLSFILYFVVRDVFTPKKVADECKLWPILASSLFLLHPLHPEVVTWIGGRVDCVVGTFYFAAIYCYALWRKTSLAKWFRLTIACLILGLCSKEMCITLPPFFCLYELVISTVPTRSWLVRLRDACKSTLPFWYILIGYFLLRRISLGTFVGGYDDSLAFKGDWTSILTNWANSLGMIIIPFNQTLLKSNNFCLKLWKIANALILCSVAWNLIKQRTHRSAVILLIFLFFFSLVPVYKILAINGDLQSSRLGYLATAPLCCLLAFGIIALPIANLRARYLLSGLCGSLVLVMSVFFLWNNNRSWKTAGKLSNAIQAAFAKSAMQKSPQMRHIILRIPDTTYGAYVARNALKMMAGNNLTILRIEPDDKELPFAFLKRSFFDNQTDCYYWNYQTQDFSPTQMPAKPIVDVLKWENANLRDVLSTGSNPKPDNIYLLHFNKIPRSAVELMTLTFSGNEPFDPGDFRLEYSNQIFGNCSVQGELVHSAAKKRPAEFEIAFRLDNSVEWAFDTKPGDTCCLITPSQLKGTIKEVAFYPISAVAPQISVESEEQDPQVGVFKLPSEPNSRLLKVQKSAVLDCKSLRLTISKHRGRWEPPTDKRDISIRTFEKEGSVAEFRIRATDLPLHHSCDVEASELDARGQPIGFPSDSVMLLP